MKKTLLTHIFLLIFVITANSQHNVRYGTPLYKNYLPTDYNGHSQLWCSTQLQNDLMLIASNGNTIIFDGTNWKSINNTTYTRVLLEDTIKKITYFGAEGNFGYIKFNEKGEAISKSFANKLEKENQDFFIILSIEKKADKIYFIGLRKIFIYKNEKLIAVIPTTNQFRFSFKVENRIFIRETNVGLVELINDKLVKVPESEDFANESIYFILPYNNTHYLVGSKTKGLFLFSKEHKKNKIFQEISPAITNFLKTNQIMCGIVLSDGKYAIGTNLKGIIILNEDLSPYLFFNKNNGLEDNNINDIYQDKNNNIWISTNNGLSVLYYNNPINKLSQKQIDNSFIVTSLAKYNNNIFCGTMGNIEKITLSNYEQSVFNENFFLKEIYDLPKTSTISIKNNKNDIIASTRDGVYCLTTNNNPKLIDPLELNFAGMFSKYDSTIFFNGSINGIDIFHKNLNKNWENIGKIATKTSVVNISEQNKGEIYASAERGLLYKIKIKNYLNVKDIEILELDTSTGINQDETIKPYFFKNRVLINQKKAILQIEKNKKKFVNITKKLARYNDNSNENIIPYNINENFIYPNKTYFGVNFLGNITQIKVTDSGFYFTNKPFRNLDNSGYFQIINDTIEKCIWFSGPSGLFNYYYNQKALTKPYKAIIYRVTQKNDSILMNFGMGLKNTAIEYKNNTLRFDFSALYYENPEKTHYVYMLENFDKNWSDTTLENYTNYTNIPAGNYKFIVKAINVYGDESIPAYFYFKILPPWWQTWWAYSIYFVLSIIILWLFILLNIRRLKVANNVLEKTVNDRTKEIKYKNIELHKKNELITESIYYAKKIQDAIMPSENTIKQHFPNSFIIYMPSNIVSGDFTWIYKINENETIIALSDCTGHGVPGAFMSMIGNTLLNEIIIEKKITEPNQILINLHNKILVALHNKNDANVTEDGMDIVICKINTLNNKITISGANQNAYLFIDGNFNNYIGDLYSIGDPFAEKHNIQFNNSEYNFNQEFKLYLSSDGYYDQFGGLEDKKLMSSNFINELVNINTLTINQQKEKLLATFNNWKGENNQLDDVLIVGINYKK